MRTNPEHELEISNETELPEDQAGLYLVTDNEVNEDDQLEITVTMGYNGEDFAYYSEAYDADGELAYQYCNVDHDLFRAIAPELFEVYGNGSETLPESKEKIVGRIAQYLSTAPQFINYRNDVLNKWLNSAQATVTIFPEDRSLLQNLINSGHDTTGLLNRLLISAESNRV